MSQVMSDTPVVNHDVQCLHSDRDQDAFVQDQCERYTWLMHLDATHLPFDRENAFWQPVPRQMLEPLLKKLLWNNASLLFIPFAFIKEIFVKKETHRMKGLGLAKQNDAVMKLPKENSIRFTVMENNLTTYHALAILTSRKHGGIQIYVKRQCKNVRFDRVSLCTHSENDGSNCEGAGGAN